MELILSLIIPVVIILASVFITLIAYKFGDIFSWKFTQKRPAIVSKKQFKYLFFTRKKLDSDEFTRIMETIWKNTDLQEFRKLLDI